MQKLNLVMYDHMQKMNQSFSAVQRDVQVLNDNVDYLDERLEDCTSVIT